MLSCILNEKRINCYDGEYTKEQLKKWANKKILLCPACGKPYEYCHGKVKSPYFRHMDKSECEDRFSEPETEEHINGKKDLYEWIKNQPGVTDCELEGWIPETRQRPDIIFKYKGKQYVLEYQCSPIATEYLERHELYQAAGVKDIWVLGTNKYLYKKENLKSANFRTKEIERHTFYYYDSLNKLFVTKSNLDFRIFRHLNKCNYELENERYFDDLIRTMGNSQVVCNLNHMVLEDNKVVFDKDIKLFIDNIENKYIMSEIITKYALEYLKNRYDLHFIKNKYCDFCIEYDGLCFRINVKNNIYTCFEKYFDKEYFYITNGIIKMQNPKWVYKERELYHKKVDNITWNNYITFIISSLFKFGSYKQNILASIY